MFHVKHCHPIWRNPAYKRIHQTPWSLSYNTIHLHIVSRETLSPDHDRFSFADPLINYHPPSIWTTSLSFHVKPSPQYLCTERRTCLFSTKKKSLARFFTFHLSVFCKMLKNCIWRLYLKVFRCLFLYNDTDLRGVIAGFLDLKKGRSSILERPYKLLNKCFNRCLKAQLQAHHPLQGCPHPHLHPR